MSVPPLALSLMGAIKRGQKKENKEKWSKQKMKRGKKKEKKSCRDKESTATAAAV